MKYKLLLLIIFTLLLSTSASAEYIFAHTNNTIAVGTGGIFYNITFDNEAASPKKEIRHIYNSYLNDSFIIQKSGIYNIDYYMSFQDTAPAPTGHISTRVIKNGIEISGSLREEDTSKQNTDTLIGHGNILVELSVNDKIKFQFAADDTTISLDSHATYGVHKDTAIIAIERIDKLPLADEFTFKRFECDMSTTGSAFGLILMIFIVVLIWMFSFWTKIPLLNLIVGFVVCYFAWVVAACFFLANVLFIIMGLTSIIYAIIYATKQK